MATKLACCKNSKNKADFGPWSKASLYGPRTVTHHVGVTLSYHLCQISLVKWIWSSFADCTTPVLWFLPDSIWVFTLFSWPSSYWGVSEAVPRWPGYASMSPYDSALGSWKLGSFFPLESLPFGVTVGRRLLHLVENLELSDWYVGRWCWSIFEREGMHDTMTPTYISTRLRFSLVSVMMNTHSCSNLRSNVHVESRPRGIGGRVIDGSIIDTKHRWDTGTAPLCQRNVSASNAFIVQ